MADRTVKVVLTAQAQQYIAEFQKAQAQTKKTTDDVKANLERQKASMEQVGKSALLMGTVAAAGLAYIVKTTADFDAQMSQVKTLSHATADEMTQLRNAALEMGQGVGFSATQVADAETELVKAGVSVKDQLGGGLVGTLNLAAAGQMNVADATQIAASAMTQFKLQGKDVPHIADLLAAGADKALGSVADLGQGLKYVGPVADSMGISLEQTVGTLALFAQNGILADQAGTGLRGVLLSLTSPSKVASDELKKYGVNLYDAQGKFIGIDGAAQQLKDHLGGLDQATRDQALGQIFGNQQITEATILMQGGAAAVDKWTKAVDDQGFAAEQARGKLDNLNGDMSKLGAAFDTDIIKAGSGANDMLRNITQGATGLVKGVGDLPQPVLDAGVAVAALVAGVGLLGGGFLVLVPKIAAAKAAMSELNLTGASIGKTFGRGGAVMVGVTALVGALSSAGSTASLSSAQISEVEASAKKGGAALNKIFTDMNGSAMTFKDTVHEFGTDDFFGNYQSFAGPLNGAIKAITFGMVDLGKWADVDKGKLAELGSGLADLAQRDLVKAELQFNKYVKAAGGGDKAVKELLANMPDYKAKLVELASQQGKTLSQQDLYNAAQGKGVIAQELAARGAAENTTKLQALAGQAQDATGDVGDLADALSNFGKGALDESSATIAFKQAVDDAAQSVKDNGATLDLNTQKGRDNQRSLDQIASSAVNMASAQAAAGASQDQLTATVQMGRDEFIKSALQMGLNAGQANALADQYHLIPADVPTAVSVTGVGEAKNQISGMQLAIDSLTGKTVYIYAQADIASARAAGEILRANSMAAANAYATGGVYRAAGGAIYGPGGPRDDRVPIMASNGEHMFTASDVAAMGGQGAVYAFRANLHRGFADGGAVTYAPMSVTPAAPQVTVRTSDRPIYMGGELFGMLREMANGEAQIVVNADKARDTRHARMG